MGAKLNTPKTKVHANQWQTKFLKRCHEEFDAYFCQYADAQIQSEGGYNPHRWAEYASEGYCSWGMFQNNVCVHNGFSQSGAEYIYKILINPTDDRQGQYAYLLDGNWQIEELLKRYKRRMNRHSFKEKWCQGKEIMGETLSPNLYCALRLHNWGGGRNYVARVISKKQELYN